MAALQEFSQVQLNSLIKFMKDNPALLDTSVAKTASAQNQLIIGAKTIGKSVKEVKAAKAYLLKYFWGKWSRVFDKKTKQPVTYIYDVSFLEEIKLLPDRSGFKKENSMKRTMEEEESTAAVKKIKMDISEGEEEERVSELQEGEGEVEVLEEHVVDVLSFLPDFKAFPMLEIKPPMYEEQKSFTIDGVSPPSTPEGINALKEILYRTASLTPEENESVWLSLAAEVSNLC